MEKFRCPPKYYASGANTPFDDLVGFQLVTGGGLTQANFEFTHSFSEKANRNFTIGVFSEGISLEDLNFNNLYEARKYFTKQYGVYPSLDVSDVSNYVLYGSLEKRFQAAISKIVRYFPAAIEVLVTNESYISGATAYNISYDNSENETTFTVDVNWIRNPFQIEFSKNATINIENREEKVSFLRNLTNEYNKYSLFFNDGEYEVTGIIPTDTTFSGELTFIVKGKPFIQTHIFDNFFIKPNTYFTELSFINEFDEIEKYILNRNGTTPYVSIFEIPRINSSGELVTIKETIQWNKRFFWNLDITPNFLDDLLKKFSGVGEEMDDFKTNLISRFYVSDSLMEFDTPDKKFHNILQIYGRSFDETKKFIDGLALMNSVHYTPKNDIPSQLLKNLSMTLGWRTNISPISEENFLSLVFSGEINDDDPFTFKTPNELNFQFYRNLILNSAYLFKSKGTRSSIEFILRMIGAPESLIEFNEHVYLADGPININDFNEKILEISGGSINSVVVNPDPNNTFSILGNIFTGFSSSIINEEINPDYLFYPVDSMGYPKIPDETDSFFFQKGFGWFEVTPEHRGPAIVNTENSVFRGNNPNVEINIEQQTYGEKYFNVFRNLPYLNMGFNLDKIKDNKKSWDDLLDIRRDGNGTNFYSNSEKLILNAKNVEIFINPSQGLLFDVWDSSNKFEYPIPNKVLSIKYPSIGGLDWTTINPQPKKYSFFEFADTFWKNMINVRNRLYITDGKTGGYPTLSSIFWKYMETSQTVCIPDNKFTYQKLIDYVEKIGDFWIRMVEQMVPATTIWETGIKYENSIFHRQKYVYRRQMGCQIIPVPCEPCVAQSPLFPTGCSHLRYECVIMPERGRRIIPTIFNTLLQSFLTSVDLNPSQCQMQTLTSIWSYEVTMDGTSLLEEEFYTGYGMSDMPTEQILTTSLLSNLSEFQQFGYIGYLTNGTLVLRTLNCSPPLQNFPHLKTTIKIKFILNCD